MRTDNGADFIEKRNFFTRQTDYERFDIRTERSRRFKNNFRVFVVTNIESAVHGNDFALGNNRVKLGKRFRELTGKKELLMRRAKEKEVPKKDAPEDSELLKRLKALRQKIARAKGVPAYVIFTDATLSELARRKPGNMEELLEVSGIGAVKAERYGKKFLEELKK